MFYLHHSNRTENLMAQLSEVLRLDGQRDPFAPEYFLIQSQGMERMLSQRLSHVFGSWCNYEYMLPTRFFSSMAQRLGVHDGPEDYGREQLCWHLDAMFRSISGEIFTPLIRYMKGDGNGLKRYQLAQQLAYVFDQYQIMRLAMIDGWEKGQLSTESPSEGYQMELWNMLVARIGHSRHRGAFLRDLIQLLEVEVDYDVLPRRLSVFGIHSMPPILLSCLRALAIHCDVHFYLLAPCEQFWGDQLTAKAQLKGGGFSENSPQGEEGSPLGHPLLAALGQQGREFQNMLMEEIDVAQEYPSFDDPLRSGHTSLLCELQSDLLGGTLRPALTAFVKDDSLIVTSAHSPHREMMILRDRILYWLDQDPDLALKDIVVMAPDIQKYSALIPALFHDIPHSVADKNPALSNPFLAVFLQFMRLVSGRFPWSEVLDLLEREQVYPSFSLEEADLETIRHWVVDSGIRWGLSVAQKQDLGLPGRSECSWESGLARLFMGYATARSGDVAGVLPYVDIEGSAAASLGGLSLFCEILEEAWRQFSKDRSLGAWAELLGDFAGRLFGAGDDDGLVELHGLLSALGGEVGQWHQEEISYEVISHWLEGAAEEKRSSAGFLRGQLTFCSMLPMRSIPFAKVCLLGLNDGVFPKNDFHPPFDLLGEAMQVGDRSRRSDDRYQFLEAILSARSSLYLSYVGQSIRSNDEIPPSVVVSEIIELMQFYKVKGLVDVHPLHGFSLEYFNEDSSLFSYERQLLQVGVALHAHEYKELPWWHGRVERVADASADVEAFLAFFRDPQKYFVRQVLGISFGFREAGVEESEPFTLHGLESYVVDQELVAAEVSGVDRQQMQQQVQASAQWPLGTPGGLGFTEKYHELSPFTAEVKSHLQQGQEEGSYLDGNFYGLQLSGRLGALYGDGRFLFRYANLKGKDILGAWVYHCLSHVCLGEERETTLLGRDMELIFPAGCVREGDLADLVALFLHGLQAPSPLMVEAAFVYAQQAQKTEESGRGDPVAKARASVENQFIRYKNSQWELLFRGQESEDLCTDEWLAKCEWFYESIWKRAHVREC
jgi:exodeoxyribonuclease V gamma subunit